MNIWKGKNFRALLPSGANKKESYRGFKGNKGYKGKFPGKRGCIKIRPLFLSLQIIMERLLLIIFIILFSLTGCKKNRIPDTSGTATINNTLAFDSNRQTYYAFGFLFSQAKLVSILDSPPPDITIDNDGTLYNLIIQANNYKNSFYKAGEYNNASSAKQAFNNLTAPSVPQWVVWADSVKADQVWIYKSGTDHYAKFRIISTVSETRSGRDYAECTFEWRYQPDGSLTFPAK